MQYAAIKSFTYRLLAPSRRPVAEEHCPGVMAMFCPEIIRLAEYRRQAETDATPPLPFPCHLQ